MPPANVCVRSKPSTSFESIGCAQGQRVSWTRRKIDNAQSSGPDPYSSLLAREKGHGQARSPPQAGTFDYSSLIQTALLCRGDRYTRGGTSRGGFDCSGFTRYIFAKYGIVLPHSSAAQSQMGTAVSRGELQAGDLVFFQTNRRGISHVGIYVGDNRFVHAATYGRGVTTDSS